MKSELAERWAIPRAVVFRDRPAAAFSPTPPGARVELVRRCLGGDSSIFDGTRPAIIICPTSWTADEDLSMLVEAAAGYDKLARASQQVGRTVLPALLILITGRGPLRAQYEVQIRQMAFYKVSIQTLWLPSEDYVLLMGSADLGVSCHRSASGVDLAMKVEDMFGAGVPVCALDYGPCLAEQVRQGENGLLFRDAVQLAEQFCELFRGFPTEAPLLKSLRKNVARLQAERWNDGWKLEAAPVLVS
jgi:beta-1,4-mannosyltransferase